MLNNKINHVEFNLSDTNLLNYHRISKEMVRV